MKKNQTKKGGSAFLPVRPAAFAVLAALAEGPRPGFEILQTIEETVPGRAIFGPGTLYRLLRELRKSRWIERTTAPGGEELDERRQYHALTAMGRSVLVAEATRLRRTLDGAGLLSHPPRG